jgi:hypothetical protein
LLALGEPTNAMLRVAADAGGEFHASVHRSWPLALDYNVSHIVLDATVDVEALKRIRPDAVVMDPPGAAACVHAAEQWWQEISPGTSPAVVVDAIERVLDAKGWKRAALMLCKRHRDVLFPRTRTTKRVPMDKPANVDAIAEWNAGKVSTTAASTDARRRAAEELARRVDRIRERLARDEHGNVMVEHHRGTRSRGSNAFMADAGVDGLAVIGHTRTNPVDIVGHLLATGMAQAVAAGDGAWGDVEGELPHVDGTTRRMRWRGYACPHWGAAARAINRADLEQTAARGRPNLDGGVPVLVVAAEPCGLPLADPPAQLPAGVAAVVAAIRRLTGGGSGVAQIATGGGGESGNRSIGHGGLVGGESCQRSIGHPPHPPVSIGNRSIGHTPTPYLIERLPIETPPTPGVSMDAIRAEMPTVPERTVRTWLADAVDRGLLQRTGDRRWTRYTLAAPAPDASPAPAPAAVPAPATPPATSSPAPAPQVVVRLCQPPANVEAPPGFVPLWFPSTAATDHPPWVLPTGPMPTGPIHTFVEPPGVGAGMPWRPTGPAPTGVAS